ncbi:peptidase M23 [Domibacillus epiphyticus]|uniref:Peptidase M23 n=1 Tax=Domibacillus epiphyticus TaxID=1714355 RepID=A0A1V2A498_9BACI|nr:peptidase M23 [Domibacillus epiphyticus]
MKRRSYMTLVIAASLGVSLTGETLAANLSNLEQRQQEIQTKKSGLENGITEKEQQISELQQQQDQITIEIRKLDKVISETESKIRSKEKSIAETKSEIERLQSEIEELKIRIAERTVVLEERARSIQQSGGSASYIEVLLGAESFSDFVNRATAVTTLVNADKEILNEQEQDKKQLEENQRKIKKQLASLESMLKELETMNVKLAEKRSAKNKVMKGLVADEHEAHEKKLSLEEEQSILDSQEASIKAAIKEEEARIAEDKRRAAEAKAARDIPASHSAPTETNRSTATPANTGGMFMRPAQGTFTSGYGMRSRGNHKGVDIANSVSVPIVAAADGVVSRSYYSDTYGNAIFISHSINGQVYTTVYAHLSERVVNSGSVKKGQTIGYMGNTGRSSGQHLHFEIHKGPWTIGKENAVDPAQYINF